MAIQTIQLGSGGGGFVKAHGFAALSTNVYKSSSSVTGEEDITSDSPVVSIEGKGFLSHISIPSGSIVNIVIDDNSKFKAYTSTSTSDSVCLLNINSPYITYFHNPGYTTTEVFFEIPGYTSSSSAKKIEIESISSYSFMADSIMNGYTHSDYGRCLSNIGYYDGSSHNIFCGSRFYFTKSIKIYVRYYYKTNTCKPVCGIIGLEV